MQTYTIRALTPEDQATIRRIAGNLAAYNAASDIREIPWIETAARFAVNVDELLAMVGRLTAPEPQPEWAKPGEQWVKTPQGGWWQPGNPVPFQVRGDDDAPIVAAETGTGWPA